MVKFAKWLARESFVCVSLCGVKVVLVSFSSGCKCDMLVEIR
jgi:hypothetical protein